MESQFYDKINFNRFKWLNEPPSWKVDENNLTFVTKKTDFWQKTYYNFSFNSGHLFGVDIKDDFTMEVCVQANYDTLYDQAGLMLYIGETHWLKAGIEYNDDQPMISCVLTNKLSDWSTGIFKGDPKKFWLRVTRKGEVVCVKFSTDNKTWYLLRLCPFPKGACLAGPMACSPQRDGLNVLFTDVKLTIPEQDILHGN